VGRIGIGADWQRFVNLKTNLVPVQQANKNWRLSVPSDPDRIQV
jgi:hypothetical protein